MTKTHWKKSVFRAAAFLTALTMLLSAVACSDQKDAAAVSALGSSSNYKAAKPLLAAAKKGDEN